MTPDDLLSQDRGPMPTIGPVVDLFAGICVADYAAPRAWHEQLLGSEPSFVAHETECVWELGFDALMDDIALRGIEPAKCETYSNGVRKATYHNPDGNGIGYGGPALDGAVT